MRRCGIALFFFIEWPMHHSLSARGWAVSANWIICSSKLSRPSAQYFRDAEHRWTQRWRKTCSASPPNCIPLRLKNIFLRNCVARHTKKNLQNLHWSSSSSVCSLFGHSSGFGNKVCRIELSGSYSKQTPAVGFHLACSLPKPFFAYALNFNSWPLRSFMIKISSLLSPYSLSSSSRCLDVTGSTRESLDFKSAVVTWRVCSSLHFTSNVNSTLHSVQKSKHEHSRVFWMRSTTSSEINGIKPIRCARNSSASTVELASNCTQSMASVGVSAMKTRRKLFAKLKLLKKTKTYELEVGRQAAYNSSWFHRRCPKVTKWSRDSNNCLS